MRPGNGKWEAGSRVERAGTGKQETGRGQRRGRDTLLRMALQRACGSTCPESLRRMAGWFLLVTLLAVFPLPASHFPLPAALPAQIDPSHTWFTIRTAHFYLHFTRPVEPLARRLAVHAESAYAALSKELHPPRGMIDIVVTDDSDRSNGSATPYPTNRIVVYANPPVSDGGLRYTNDWGEMVVTHELTHIFHLDRTRGVWALSQHVFGRAALAFPNLYQPSWLTEGLAVYEETRIAGAGRVEGSEHRMIARAAALDGAFPGIGALSLAQGRNPFASSAYAFGSLFIDYLAKTRGEARVRTLVEKSSANLVPYLLDIPARQSFGVSFSRGWGQFRDSIARTIHVGNAAPLEGWRDLTHDGVFAFAPRWISDTSIIYAGAPGRESFAAYRVGLGGRRTRVGRRNSSSPNILLPDGSFLFSQLEYVSPYSDRSDLWIQRGRGQHRLTTGQRLFAPDVRGDGSIVAVQIIPGATRLARVSRDGTSVMPITSGSYDEQWTEPRWSHAGNRIVASRWLRGNISQIVVIDTTGRIVHTVSSGTSIESTPSWLDDDEGVLFNSDRAGATQVYVQRFAEPQAFAGAMTYRLSDVVTGLFEPTAAPTASRAAAIYYRADGYHLGVGDCCAPTQGERVPEFVDNVPRRLTVPIIPDTVAATRYSPWRTLWPRFWLPTLEQGIRSGYRIGAMTTGVDVLRRHALDARLLVPTDKLGGVVGSASYTYSGLGLPVLQADVAQEWESLGGIADRESPQTVTGELFRRTRSADLLASWVRAGYRTATTITAGPAIEQWSHVTTPSGLIPSIDSTGQFGTLMFPSLIVAGSFVNYQRPVFSISPEDGVQLNVTLRDRLHSGANATGGQSFSAVGTAALYKSIDLPGFAHHVIALRGAAGVADSRTNAYYSVGGVSGSPFQVISGYVLGEGRKTFPVRGFDAATILGTRAFAGSAEYRVPLWLIGGGPGVLPFFFDRSSLTLFGDYGTAWCPTISRTTEVCNRADQDRHVDIGSIGAEINLNLGVLSWDSPYRFRLGVVHPTQNGPFFVRQSVQVYLVSGASF
jgi:hypothetical protein